MKLQSIKPTNSASEKRYTATFTSEGKQKTVHFGLKGGRTFIDHKDEKKKSAYLARHKVNENWNDPLTAGALARFILWNKPTLQSSIKDFRRRFDM